MRKTVIFGGSGLLGLNLSRILRDSDDVILVLHRKVVDLAGTRHVTLDLATDDIAGQLENLKPDLVISAAADTDVEFCELNPSAAHLTNVQLNSEIARACAHMGVQNVFISTDHIFDNSKGNSSEWENVKLLNTYAKTKYEAEHRVLISNSEALVTRTNFFAWGPRYRASFVDWLFEGLKSGTVVELFDDVYFTPIYVGDFWQGVEQALSAQMNGVVHLGGGERLSKYEFGIRLCQSWGQDQSLIRRGTIASRKDLVRRPRDMSLSNDRMNTTLSWQPRNLKFQIEALTSERESEWGTELKKISVRGGFDPELVPYSRQHVSEEDVDAVSATLRRGPLTQGPKISELERSICRYTEAEFAVAVSSATAGLHISYQALGVGPTDCVLTSPISFVSTANAASFLGASVAFADVEAETANLSTSSVEKVLASQRSEPLLVPVHFAGLATNYEELELIAKTRQLVLVEDAAHSLGGSYSDGSMVGSCRFSDATIFSMHPVKSITSGEGGVITTNHRDLYQNLLTLRSHGINKGEDDFLLPEQASTLGQRNPWYYEMQVLGYNYRLTDIQASLAISQLQRLDEFVLRRRERAVFYDTLLAEADLPNISFVGKSGRERSANHLYVLKIDFEAIGKTRVELMNHLKRHGFISQVHYLPIPMHPYYSQRGYAMTLFPNSKEYYARCISLPLHVMVTPQQQRRVVNLLETFLSE